MATLKGAAKEDSKSTERAQGSTGGAERDSIREHGGSRQSRSLFRLPTQLIAGERKRTMIFESLQL